MFPHTTFCFAQIRLAKPLLFLSSNRKKQSKCCSNRNFINSNNIDSNQGKTRKQEEKGSFWTKGEDTCITSGGKQLKCKPLADPHFWIPTCRQSHRAEFYFRNFSRRIQRCCGDQIGGSFIVSECHKNISLLNAKILAGKR